MHTSRVTFTCVRLVDRLVLLVWKALVTVPAVPGGPAGRERSHCLPTGTLVECVKADRRVPISIIATAGKKIFAKEGKPGRSKNLKPRTKYSTTGCSGRSGSPPRLGSEAKSFSIAQIQHIG
jgi:hypothetical protein